MLFLFVAPAMYFVILLSYPYMRMREFGHSLGSKSAGQNTDGNLPLLLFAGRVRPRPVSTFGAVFSDDFLISRGITLRKRFLCPSLPSFDDSGWEDTGDVGVLGTLVQAHVLYGWPCNPWTIMILGNSHQVPLTSCEIQLCCTHSTTAEQFSGS
jgi:hypothetical protein